MIALIDGTETVFGDRDKIEKGLNKGYTLSHRPLGYNNTR